MSFKFGNVFSKYFGISDKILYSLMPIGLFISFNAKSIVILFLSLQSKIPIVGLSSSFFTYLSIALR